MSLLAQHPCFVDGKGHGYGLRFDLVADAQRQPLSSTKRSPEGRA